MLKDVKLTYEEFLRLLAQIEAIVKLRPLNPLSSDPNDHKSLTTSHLLNFNNRPPERKWNCYNI